MEFLVDSNLGLPVDQKPWNELLPALGIATTLTNDLAALDRSVAGHGPDIVFLPVSDFHRLLAGGDTHYRGLVIVTSKFTGAVTLPSVLVVGRDDPADSVADLRGARLGYINRSRSSSYFCPAILLSSRGEQLDGFFELVPTEPWQGQIDAVTSANVRATMVIEDVWRSTPANAEDTRIIDRYDHATGAVIIIRDGIDEVVVAALMDALLAWRPSPAAVYGPFTAYRDADVGEFFRDMERLPAGF